MKELVEKINHVLANWNPIDVDESIALEEYKSYVPIILKSIGNKQTLRECLENILINQMGISYSSANKEHAMDLNDTCDKLIQAYFFGS